MWRRLRAVLETAVIVLRGEALVGGFARLSDLWLACRTATTSLSDVVPDFYF